MLSAEPYAARLIRRMASTVVLRFIMGLLSMILKFSWFFVAGIRAGVRPPPFKHARRGCDALSANGQADESAASAMADLVGLRDVFFESADGTRLHAVRQHAFASPTRLLSRKRALNKVNPP